MDIVKWSCLYLIPFLIFTIKANLPGVNKTVEGTVVKNGEFPYQLKLNFPGSSCGAVLIDKTTALTAAHCIRSNHLEGYELVAGEHDLTLSEGTEQRAELVDIQIHSEYNINNFTNDIALLHIAEGAFTLNAHVQPIQLPSQNQIIPEGLNGTTRGWSRTNIGRDEIIPYFLKNVPIVTNPECTKNHSRHHYFKIQNSMMCTGAVGIGSSQGYEGSPLVIQNYTNGRDLLVGLTSFETWNGQKHYGVYTRVSEYIEWIQNSRGLARVIERPCGDLITIRSDPKMLSYKNNENVSRTCIWGIDVNSELIRVSVVDLDLTTNGIGVLIIQNGASKSGQSRATHITNEHKTINIVAPSTGTFIVFKAKPGQSVYLQLRRENGHHQTTSRISLRPQIDGQATTINSHFRYYSENERHHFVVEEAPGKKIVLTVTFVETETNYDFMKVYAFSKDENRFRLLQTFTGQLGQVNKTFVGSEGQPMLIYFESDETIEYKGFTFTYKYETTISNSDSCGGVVRLPRQHEILYRNSNGQETCTWIILATYVAAIQYTWHNNSISNNASSKLNFHAYDELNFFSVPLLLGAPEVKLTNQGSVGVLTYTSMRGEGFKMNLTSLDETQDHPIDWNNFDFTTLGQNYPPPSYSYDVFYLEPEVERSISFAWPSSDRVIPYPDDAYYLFIIKSHSDRRIQLNVNYLDTEMDKDFLIILEFSKRENTFVFRQKLTGRKGALNETFEGAIGEPFQLRFRSDEIVQGAGFVISYVYK